MPVICIHGGSDDGPPASNLFLKTSVMLKTVSPVLSPEILYVFARMGHGDEVVISDANFPAASRGIECIEAPGITVSDLLHASLPLFPLDYRFKCPAFSMSSKEDTLELSEAAWDYKKIIQKHEGDGVGVAPLLRQDFYDRALNAFCVIRTGDRRRFANIILRKGVV